MKIYEFRKNAFEKLIIQFTEYKGKKLIDLRVFYDSGENKEDYRPTHKGISLSREMIPEIKEGIDRAFKEWKKKA